MPKRLSLRLVDALTGKLAAVPGSLVELLALATKKLKLTSHATRIFIHLASAATRVFDT